LKAFLSEQPAVLLIDEIDKSDEEFESFLLEALSDFAVSIPERGTVQAKTIPMVFLTSNGMRDFSDGLKRRCVHYYIDYPTMSEEYAIIKAKFPKFGDALAHEIAAFICTLRQKKLQHKPGIAEVLDWVEVLCDLGIENISDPKIGDTYHFLVKSREDFLSLAGESKN
jgi:MoxR-like ATPase